MVDDDGDERTELSDFLTNIFANNVKLEVQKHKSDQVVL